MTKGKSLFESMTHECWSKLPFIGFWGSYKEITSDSFTHLSDLLPMQMNLNTTALLWMTPLVHKRYFSPDNMIKMQLHGYWIKISRSRRPVNFSQFGEPNTHDEGFFVDLISWFFFSFLFLLGGQGFKIPCRIH